MSATVTGNVYPVKPNSTGNIQVQFWDARSATEATEPGDKYPAVKEIIGYGTLPAIQEARRNEQLVEFQDRGRTVGWENDNDSIDIPEITFDLDITSGSVSGTSPDTNFDLSNWFELATADDSYGSGSDTELISTNTGSVNVRAEGTATPVSLALPTNVFTLGMSVLFSNGETGKSFCYEFNNVKIVSCTKDSDLHGMFHLTVAVYSAFTLVEGLKTQTTVT